MFYCLVSVPLCISGYWRTLIYLGVSFVSSVSSAFFLCLMIFYSNASDFLFASLPDPFPLHIFLQDINCRLPEFILLSFLKGFYSVFLLCCKKSPLTIPSHSKSLPATFMISLLVKNRYRKACLPDVFSKIYPWHLLGRPGEIPQTQEKCMWVNECKHRLEMTVCFSLWIVLNTICS